MNPRRPRRIRTGLYRRRRYRWYPFFTRHDTVTALLITVLIVSTALLIAHLTVS